MTFLFDFFIETRIHIYLDEFQKMKPRGLCGNFDDQGGNDYMQRSGISTGNPLSKTAFIDLINMPPFFCDIKYSSIVITCTCIYI